jgi:hypothetical protein
MIGHNFRPPFFTIGNFGDYPLSIVVDLVILAAENLFDENREELSHDWCLRLDRIPEAITTAIEQKMLV